MLTRTLKAFSTGAVGTHCDFGSRLLRDSTIISARRYSSSRIPPWLRRSRNGKEQHGRGGGGRRISLPSSTTHDITADVLRGGQGASAAAAVAAAPPVPLPALNCPGGPRVKSEGIKHLYKVPHAGYLAKYDQRFILNLKLTHQIVSYLSRHSLQRSEGKLVVELGPGAGSLTRSLLTRPGLKVLGIERDERFAPLLQQIQNYTEGQFQWCCEDVLSINELDVIRRLHPGFAQENIRFGPGAGGGSQSPGRGPLRSARRERYLQRYWQEEAEASAAAGAYTSGTSHAIDADQRWASGDCAVEVVANLPFAIISELMIRYCVDCSNRENIFAFGRVPVHVFTQAEVAQHLTATAGSEDYSRLSVLVQCYFHVRFKQSFTEYTFYPRTEVRGSFLTLEPRAVPLIRGLRGAVLAHFLELLMPTVYAAGPPEAEGEGDGGEDADVGTMEPLNYHSQRHDTNNLGSNSASDSFSGAKRGGGGRSARRSVSRGSTVHKAMSRFLPAEVVQYILQESGLDGALSVLDLKVEEVGQLATLWHRYVEASNQQYTTLRGHGTDRV